jgi:hydrogenase nickel incorporation protein HypA/HybF
MHELAITESIVAAVAERMGDTPIRRLKVEIGRLSGVVPDAVRFCFELAAAGTTLEGAALEIDELPGRVRCRSCGVEFDTDDVIAICMCGGVGGEAVRGAELRIREVEVL